MVHRGAPQPWNEGAVHEDSGDRGWWYDFSAVRESGEFYVYDPSTGLRSPVFRIAADVYHPILVAAVRTYFYQRLGVPLRPPHAEEPWVFEAALLQDREARAVWAQDDPATERDLSGGWMDAGDTNKYPP
ncbi:MAG: glycoside hydrolase family 9, partial [Puniceicoccaceae bacterium]